MIKTIDTNEITEEMLYAGVYAAERCADAGIIDLKDVVYEAIFSALEVAPAVKPAQAAIKCKDCLDTGEQLGVYGRIKCSCKEPAQAVPVGYVSGWINGHLALRLLDPALALSTGTALFLQLHTVPPAIEDETRKMVLELCKVVDNYTDIPLTKQIREKLEADNV